MRCWWKPTAARWPGWAWFGRTWAGCASASCSTASWNRPTACGRGLAGAASIFICASRLRRASKALAEWQTPKIEAAARPSAELQRAVKVLNADIPVLLLGETGVGKEVFARALHAASRRGRGPFVAVNCAAIPEALIESELFGYEEGAFTGARRKGMAGKLREASGGVLFLDEVGDMPAAMQARLLRALQQREVTPLGGGQTHAVDFALICATHRDLAAMTASGEFRAICSTACRTTRYGCRPCASETTCRA
ncbi:sigma-54 factor interaction domain-containing protein [Chromobacterium haemolyticum]|nr:sigma-54 factor interaction domain-containing protein [Chromobacterium haemolyticum]